MLLTVTISTPKYLCVQAGASSSRNLFAKAFGCSPPHRRYSGPARPRYGSPTPRAASSGLHLLGGCEIGIVLLDCVEQDGRLRVQLVIRGEFSRLGIRCLERLAARRDRLEDLLLVSHLALHGRHEVRDEVRTALHHVLDLRPIAIRRPAWRRSWSYTSAADRNPQKENDDDGEYRHHPRFQFRSPDLIRAALHFESPIVSVVVEVSNANLPAARSAAATEVAAA